MCKIASLKLSSRVIHNNVSTNEKQRKDYNVSTVDTRQYLKVAAGFPDSSTSRMFCRRCARKKTRLQTRFWLHVFRNQFTDALPFSYTLFLKQYNQPYNDTGPTFCSLGPLRQGRLKLCPSLSSLAVCPWHCPPVPKGRWCVAIDLCGRSHTVSAIDDMLPRPHSHSQQQ